MGKKKQDVFFFLIRMFMMRTVTNRSIKLWKNSGKITGANTAVSQNLTKGVFDMLKMD